MLFITSLLAGVTMPPHALSSSRKWPEQRHRIQTVQQQVDLSRLWHCKMRSAMRLAQMGSFLDGSVCVWLSIFYHCWSCTRYWVVLCVVCCVTPVQAWHQSVDNSSAWRTADMILFVSLPLSCTSESARAGSWTFFFKCIFYLNHTKQ